MLTILCVDVRQPDLRTLRHTSTRARPSRLYTSHRKIYYNSPLRAMLAICAVTCTFLHPRPKSISRRFAKIHFERLLILSLHTHARKQTKRHTCRCTPFWASRPCAVLKHVRCAYYSCAPATIIHPFASTQFDRIHPAHCASESTAAVVQPPSPQ